MGCCCSKQEIEEKENEKEKALKKQRWEPPPPPPEEETVKEVLSETPKAKPKAPSSPVLKPVEKEPNEDEQLEKKPKPKPKATEILPSDDRSEQPQPSDDGCSLSEVSNATSATTTREKEREEISTGSTTSSLPRIPRSNNASGYNRKSYSGELFGGGGSRRERSSPAVVTGLGCRSGRTSPGPQSRNRSLSGNVNGVKRDVGERSGRRSLSPGAKRREVMGPGGHGEKFGANRGVPVKRVPPLPPYKAAATATQLPDGGGGPGTEGKESLENPSVSLECFIFL